MRATSFRPTREQEEELVNYLIARLTTLKTDNAERLEADRLAWLSYNNDQSRRIDGASVFRDREHNLALPITSMIVESFIARAEDQVTGADPFIKFQPQGNGPVDTQTAKDFDHYFRWKLDTKGKVKTVLEDAYTAIFVQRAAVFKSIWVDKPSQWLDPNVNVLWRVGQPVQSDDVSVPDAQAPNHSPDGEPIEYLDENGKPQFIVENETPWAVGPGGEQILEADPTIIFDPTKHAWRPAPEALRRSSTIYKGPKAVLLDYDTFLCPTAAPSVEEADCTAELYDKQLTWAQAIFVERPWFTWQEYYATCKNNSAKPTTDIDRNKENKEELRFDANTASVKLVEFWVRRDVLGWGEPQEFMVVIDPDQQKAIYYEFQAIVCPDHRRPYTAIAIGRQKGRWWGYNLPEKIDQYQQYADKQFQRESSRNELNANPIGTWNPDIVEEEPDQLDIGGGLYRLKKGKRHDDFVKFSAIPDLDTKTHALIEFIVYMVQLWLGVSNLSQGDYADVPENSTKYGIEQSLREASKIGRRWMRRIQRGFEELLGKLVKLQIANFDAEEVYTYMEGNVVSFASMGPERAKNIELDVALVLSQEIRQQDIQAAQTALAVQEKYFLTPDNIKPATRPLFEKILNSLGMPNTDQLLPLPQIDQLTGMPVAHGMPGSLEQPAPVAQGPIPDKPGSATSPTNWPGEQPVNDPTEMTGRPTHKAT